jgi:betaine-aldehyde dehydrogenase
MSFIAATSDQQLTPLPSEPFVGRLLIDGKWVEAQDGGRMERMSPAHDVLVASYAQAGVADTERAILAARNAFDRGPWPHMKGADRATVLRRAAEAIERRNEELALLETLENGKPWTQSRAEIAQRRTLALRRPSRATHGDSYNTLGSDTSASCCAIPLGSSA